MSDDYKAQVSLRFGPMQAAMLNLRADSINELDVLIDLSEQSIVKMGGLIEAANALAAVGQAMPGTTVVTQPAPAAPSAWPGPTQPAPAPAFGGQSGQMCPHGAMVYKEGPDWKGHFCPAQRDDPTKCKARYIR